jgi:outer membrane protein assembly factor BamD (BamD/ComL family)
VARAPERERDSSLTAPNDLFQEGVALRRQGDASGALRAYQALLTRFPGSPLVENAMAERLRLLAKTGDARASAEARRYLERFPHGFAANEARAMVAKP